MPQEERTPEEQTIVDPNTFSWIDKPFHIVSEHFLSTLRRTRLGPTEAPAIQDSIIKYVTSTRNAFLMSLMATPGILANDPMKLMGFMVAIASVTGIAWFTISLEKVKERYIPFGVELTTDMLEAFLTCCMMLFVISNTLLLSERGAKYLPAENPFSSDLNWFLATFLTLLVTARISWKTISSTIKFDANDALLAGRTELEMKFYQNKLSVLKEISSRLRDGQELAAANHSIAEGLGHYYLLRDAIGRSLPEQISAQIKKLHLMGQLNQEEFDQEVLQLMEVLLADYESLIKREDKRLSFLLEISKNKLLSLRKEYSSKEDVTQSHADATFAMAFETLAALIEDYGEQLPNLAPSEE